MDPGRYYAHLDSIHTIVAPPPEQLKDFLRQSRVARLTIEFVRDLHVRLFGAFASLGFDDVGWFSDVDLSWLIDLTERELLEKKGKLQDLKAQASGREASGVKWPEKRVDQQLKEVANLEEEIRTMESEVLAYQQELQRRPPQPQ